MGVHVAPAPYLPYAYSISEFNHILALDAFIKGKIVVQDVSSMLVAEVADPKKGDYVIDVCAAPGGKSLHMGDKMEGYGTVDARDVSQYKVNLIEENIQRTNSINVQARVQDATIFDRFRTACRCRNCRCTLFRIWSDRQEAGDQIPCYATETG